MCSSQYALILFNIQIEQLCEIELRFGYHSRLRLFNSAFVDFAGKSETAMSTSSDYLESASRPRLALSSSSNVPPPSGVQGRAAPAPYFSTVLDPPSEQLKTHGRLFSFNKKTSSVTFQVRPHSRSTSSFQPAPLCSSEDLLDLSDFPSPPQSPPIETSQVHNI